MVVPVLKKGKGVRVEKYRGVTLTQTTYKVYAAVLVERLKEEVKSGGLLPPSQARFTKGMGAMDHIYVLNSLIKRGWQLRKGKWLLCLLT